MFEESIVWIIIVNILRLLINIILLKLEIKTKQKLKVVSLKYTADCGYYVNEIFFRYH